VDLKIKNKKALVLGASSGLGRAVAQSLVNEGVQVAICSRDEKRINQAAKDLKAHLALTCDLSQPGAATKLVEQVLSKWGNIDILVTNTGGPPKGNFADLKRSQWETGFQDLWLSTVEAIQGVLPGMIKEKWGRLLLITSVAAKEPMPSLTISNGLRAGLLGLTKTMSQEYAVHGITVNALLPGYTDTERLQELAVPAAKMTSQIPAGRLGRPEELGALAAFLASNQASYVTGQAIAVDGGYLRGI
jgi:3-oxoacyl-[acyl-carrier protein] reductase